MKKAAALGALALAWTSTAWGEPPAGGRWRPTELARWKAAPPPIEGRAPDFLPCKPAAGRTLGYRVTGREVGGPTAKGYADIHLHQFAHMQFGGRVVHGSNEKWDHIEDKPLSREAALPERCSGNWGDHGFIVGLEGPVHMNRRKLGKGWPRWDANAHQQIFDEWLEKAHADGLNLIVVSVTDFEYNCRLTPYGRGPHAKRKAGSCNYWDSTIAQLKAAHGFERRHPWYKIVTTPREAREAIAAGKLAVVLHVEMSGPFGTQALAPDWKSKFDLLYDKYKVRSFMVAHELDSPFAGASHHESFFKLAQVLDDLGFVGKTALASLVEALRAPGITNEKREDAAAALGSALSAAAKAANLALSGDPSKTLREWISKVGFQRYAVERFKTVSHRPGDGPTWINARGLSEVGRELTREMMKRRMMIDISHISRRAVHDTMCIAEQEFGGYPVVHTHGHLQEAMGPRKADEEKSFPLSFVHRLARSGGVFGIRPSPDETRQYRGTSADGKGDLPRVPNDCHGSALSFINHYLYVDRVLELPLAFGTDMGGIPMMNPRFRAKDFLPAPAIQSFLADDNGACRPRGVSKKKARTQGRAQEAFRKTGTKTAFDETGLGRIDQLKDVLAQMRILGVSTRRLESSAETFLRSWERAYDDGRAPIPYGVNTESPRVREAMWPLRYPAGR